MAGPERIARIASENGVATFIHVSHLNASKDSKSKLYQAKAEGEERVRAAFPTATILRPSSYFGYEDRLLNNIASKLDVKLYTNSPTDTALGWAVFWKLNHGKTKIRPVHASTLIGLPWSHPSEPTIGT